MEFGLVEPRSADGMASFGHIAVGMAAGRAFSRKRAFVSMLAFSALSMLPDADVIAFVFRIPYANQFGHRGASHSVAFAMLCGVIAWLVRRDRRLALFTFVVVLSHPLLDMLTNGGLGCAILWPISAERFFWPVQPIPVAPIGAGMLSARGLLVVVTELVVFSPLVIWALLRDRKGPNQLIASGETTLPAVGNNIDYQEQEKINETRTTR